MWCRRGERLGEGGAHLVGIHRIGREGAHRAAREHGLTTARAIAKSVPKRKRSSAPGRTRSAAALPSSAMEPAHDRRADPVELAFHQVGSRSDFVGDGDLGDDQLVAVGVTTALVGVGDRPAAPIATSVCPMRQARPMVSVMTTAASIPAAAKAAACAPHWRRIARQQGEFIGGHIRPVDTGRGLDQPAVLGDQRAVLARHHAYRFVLDKAPTQRVTLFRVGRRGGPTGPRPWRRLWR